MEDGRWLRFLTIGLVLAAIVVGYFIVTGRFTAKNERVVEETQNQVQIPAEESGEIKQDEEAPQSAYDTIAQRTKGGVEELPKTGYPLYFWTVISASALIAGWGLRRFPK